jgi:hypothetical protein
LWTSRQKEQILLQPTDNKILIRKAVLKKKIANPKLKITEYTELLFRKLNMVDTDPSSYNNNPTGFHVPALYISAKMLHNLHYNAV